MFTATVSIFYGLVNTCIVVHADIAAEVTSVSEVYVEVSFASDTDRTHNIDEVTAPVPVRVTRRFDGLPGAAPTLEVKATSGDSPYPVSVSAWQGVGDQGSAPPQVTAQGTTNQAIALVLPN